MKVVNKKNEPKGSFILISSPRKFKLNEESINILNVDFSPNGKKYLYIWKNENDNILVEASSQKKRKIGTKAIQGSRIHEFSYTFYKKDFFNLIVNTLELSNNLLDFPLFIINKTVDNNTILIITPFNKTIEQLQAHVEQSTNISLEQQDIEQIKQSVNSDEEDNLIDQLNESTR